MPQHPAAYIFADRFAPTRHSHAKELNAAPRPSRSSGLNGLGLTNALKFTPLGGEILVKAWCLQLSGCVLQVAMSVSPTLLHIPTSGYG